MRRNLQSRKERILSLIVERQRQSKGEVVLLFTNTEMRDVCIERLTGCPRASMKKTVRKVYEEYRLREAELLSTWEREIRSILQPKVGTKQIDIQDIDDLTQQCLMKYSKAWQDDREGFADEPYRCKIVTNVLYDAFRRVTRRSHALNRDTTDDPVVSVRKNAPRKLTALANLAAKTEDLTKREFCVHVVQECLSMVRSKGQTRFAEVLEAYVECSGDVHKAAVSLRMAVQRYREAFSRAKAYLKDRCPDQYTDDHEWALDSVIIAATAMLAQTNKVSALTHQVLDKAIGVISALKILVSQVAGQLKAAVNSGGSLGGTGVSASQYAPVTWALSRAAVCFVLIGCISGSSAQAPEARAHAGRSGQTKGEVMATAGHEAKPVKPASPACPTGPSLSGLCDPATTLSPSGLPAASLEDGAKRLDASANIAAARHPVNYRCALAR